MSLENSETVEDVKPALAASRYFTSAPPELSLDFGAATHVGLRRGENQDRYIVLRRTRTQQLLFTNMPTEELTMPTDETYGMAVADGMGGVGSGSLASQLAIRTAWEIAGRTSSWVMKLDNLNSSELAERIEGFVYLMQQAFVQEYESNPNFRNSGTTWTAAYFVSSFVAISQIGDSPSFLWRDGTMSRITVDHTVEQEFISCGVAPEIAGKFGHMLTRCLGSGSTNSRPDVHFLRLRPHDQILICTDGLTDMVPDAFIAHAIDESRDPREACNTLIKLALDAGGKDNVTAILAKVKPR